MKTGRLSNAAKPPSPIVGELAETLLALRQMDDERLKMISLSVQNYYEAQKEAKKERQAAEEVLRKVDAAQTELAKLRAEHNERVMGDSATLKQGKSSLQQRQTELNIALQDIKLREESLRLREEAVSARERAVVRIRDQLGVREVDDKEEVA